MSFTFGTTPTATSPVTGARTLSPIPTNYASDWRIVKEGPGEAVLTNIQGSLNAPETLRIAFSEIADVFKGSKVEPGDSAASMSEVIKRGVSILIQLTGTAVANETDVPNRYPYSAHLVLKVPYGPNPTANDIQTILLRLLSHLYETSDTTVADRVSALLHGSLTPGDL